MKKMIIILAAIVLLQEATAQKTYRRAIAPARSYVYVVPYNVYDPFYRYHYWYGPYATYPNYPYDYTPRILQKRINKINDEYDKKIRKLRKDKSMPREERRKKIKQLRQERDDRIDMAEDKFYS